MNALAFLFELVLVAGGAVLVVGGFALGIIAVIAINGFIIHGMIEFLKLCCHRLPFTGLRNPHA